MNDDCFDHEACDGSFDTLREREMKSYSLVQESIDKKVN